MREEISRLVDGELPEEQFEAACSQLKQRENAATWVCYHVIGETLRGADPVPPSFSERFEARLAAEPVVLAPHARVHRPLTYAWAAAATLAAVVVTGWVAISVIQPESGVVAMAKAREAGTIRAAQVRPAAVPQDYLLAHEEYSPMVQIQGVGPGIRAVSVPADDVRQ